MKTLRLVLYPALFLIIISDGFPNEIFWISFTPSALNKAGRKIMNSNKKNTKPTNLLTIKSFIFVI